MPREDTELTGQSQTPKTYEQTDVWPPRPTTPPGAGYGMPLPWFVSGAPLAKIIILLLWVGVGCNVAEIIGDAGHSTVGRVLNILASLLESLLFFVTGILFLVWTHRSYANLIAFGAQGLRWSPGWDVGYFFTPFISLVRPYQIIQELWRASEPAPEAALPSVWQSIKASPLLLAWWLCWLASNILGYSVASLSISATLSGRSSAAEFGTEIMIDALYIVAAVLAIQVVKGITARQELRAALIAAQA